MKRLWTDWLIAIGFLREGRSQSLMIIGGVAIGVAVIVFISALIQGLQANLIERTLGTQAHISLSAPDEINRIVEANNAVQLVYEDQRAQRLRSINNWQEVVENLDNIQNLNAVSPMVSGPALVKRGEAIKSVAIMGIDLPRYQRIVPLQDYITSGQLRLKADDVLIGTEMAKRFRRTGRQ